MLLLSHQLNVFFAQLLLLLLQLIADLELSIEVFLELACVPLLLGERFLLLLGEEFELLVVQGAFSVHLSPYDLLFLLKLVYLDFE